MLEPSQVDSTVGAAMCRGKRKHVPLAASTPPTVLKNGVDCLSNKPCVGALCIEMTGLVSFNSLFQAMYGKR